MLKNLSEINQKRYGLYDSNLKYTMPDFHFAKKSVSQHGLLQELDPWWRKNQQSEQDQIDELKKKNEEMLAKQQALEA